MPLTSTRVIATLHLWYKVLAGNRSITEDFFHKAPRFVKSYMDHVDISLPPDVMLDESPSRTPNYRPFKVVEVNNDISTYSFYPRTTALLNNILLLNFTSIDNLDTLNEMLFYL